MKPHSTSTYINYDTWTTTSAPYQFRTPSDASDLRERMKMANVQTPLQLPPDEPNDTPEESDD